MLARPGEERRSPPLGGTSLSWHPPQKAWFHLGRDGPPQWGRAAGSFFVSAQWIPSHPSLIPEEKRRNGKEGLLTFPTCISQLFQKERVFHRRPEGSTEAPRRSPAISGSRRERRGPGDFSPPPRRGVPRLPSHVPPRGTEALPAEILAGLMSHSQTGCAARPRALTRAWLSP